MVRAVLATSANLRGFVDYVSCRIRAPEIFNVLSGVRAGAAVDDWLSASVEDCAKPREACFRQDIHSKEQIANIVDGVDGHRIGFVDKCGRL